MEEILTNFKDDKEEALRKVRVALLNILEDTDDARKSAVDERNKTMAIVENLTDGILLLDSKGEIEIISPMAAEFFKKTKEEIIGSNISDLVQGEDYVKLKELLFDANGKIQLFSRKELEMKEKTNLQVSTVSFKTDSHGMGMLIVLHDVTRDKLVEKMKTEFVSIAAHQLRTPLSAIKWTLRMILDGDTGEITEEQKELLEKTYVSNERMIALINDLLNVTRIEEGRFLYRQEPAQMEDIVDDIVTSCEEIIRMKKLKLDFSRPKELMPMVNVDKEKVGIAVQNLIENAAKYTPEGGNIKVSLRQEADEIIFEVHDTGVGIPDYQKERIFTKFFRGDNVIKMETDGSGLGLYTTRNIVEAHKGRIWFESKEGEGTSFFFSIPIIK